MDRAATYVAGSRHKDNVHWFINEEELENSLPDYVPYEVSSRTNVLARCMNTDRQKSMALEYFDSDLIDQYLNQKQKPSISNTFKNMEVEI